jgi:hypothetical protein
MATVAAMQKVAKATKAVRKVAASSKPTLFQIQQQSPGKPGLLLFLRILIFLSVVVPD